MSLTSNLDHNCSTRQEAYDNFVNAIFKQAYDDLVSAIRKAKRQRDVQRITRSHLRDTENKMCYQTLMKMIQDGERDVKNADLTVDYLEWWMRKVLPQWRDIDPDRIIKQAHKEAENDTEAVSDAAAASKG